MSGRAGMMPRGRLAFTGGIDRRTILAGAIAVLCSCASAAPAQTMQVYKTASCGCCSAWVDHIRAAGFKVAVRDVADVAPVAERLGVPAAFRSCHTAAIGGYFVEGHVPATDIRKLLRERPNAAGLAVPGMLVGPPGMEKPGENESYATLLIDRAGHARMYVDHSV